MEEYLEFAKELALKAGKIILDNFKIGVESRVKHDKSIVTQADEEINQLVIDEVSKKYPTHSVLGEEASVNKKSKYAWVCDPIDGTLPFAKGLPISVFSIALVEEGKPLIGVVYYPYANRLFYAVNGQGAFLNDKPIKVSNRDLGVEATIDIEHSPGSKYDFVVSSHELSQKTGTYITKLSCTINACCMVASGQFEACLFDGSKGKCMDIAAIKVIVEEAGGKVTDLFGNDQRYDREIKGAIVSNGVVHQKLIGLV